MDVIWQAPTGFATRYDGGLETLCASRELIEWHIRRRLLSDRQNITVLPEADVRGPLVEGGRCVGVKLGGRSSSAHPKELAADLTVDASGRNSPLPEWLTTMGYSPPRETVIDAFVGYASRFYEVPSPAPEWKMLFLQPRPPDQFRGGALFPIEGKGWHVTLAGYGKDYPPNDEQGFLEFAKSLRCKILYEAMLSAKPVSDIYGYRGGSNRRRHYEDLERWPSGIITLGDSVCAFNPIYGQGMTVAGVSAMALRDVLRDGEGSPWEKSFQKRLAGATETAWLLATGEDFRYRTTEGGVRPASLRLLHAYLDRVLAVGSQVQTVSETLLRVMHLMAPPSELMKPGMLWKTLFASKLQELTDPPPRLVQEKSNGSHKRA
jgi:flavin-dependent dehydrogenase